MTILELSFVYFRCTVASRQSSTQLSPKALCKWAKLLDKMRYHRWQKCFLSLFPPEHKIGVLQHRTLKPLWTLLGSMGSPDPTRPKLEFAHWKHDLLWRQFVLFGLVLSCHMKISQITVPAATLLVLLESPSWVWVHQAGFMVFRHIVQELLNIEPFFHWKFNKINTTSF